MYFDLCDLGPCVPLAQTVPLQQAGVLSGNNVKLRTVSYSIVPSLHFHSVSQTSARRS